MKKTSLVSIGGKTFSIEEDAYNFLEQYLADYRNKIRLAFQTEEVMEEVEARISDLLSEKVSGMGVVSLAHIKSIAEQIGMPDGPFNASYDTSRTSFSSEKPGNANCNAQRRFFRDKDHSWLGGVCSGLGAYFNLDILLVRIIFLVLLFTFSAGFWIYIILWIAAPHAVTPADKCAMRGWEATEENIRKVSNCK
ncbi:MAG: PspC domain-containing protein [Bacteroidales bacterium]|nr:PspC domain-containing protein [Bacteroidales bacterium]